ncbi:hypothetical protein ACP70R_027918 [Stipagrostis hirtigluma subsp. patula]
MATRTPAHVLEHFSTAPAASRSKSTAIDPGARLAVARTHVIYAGSPVHATGTTWTSSGEDFRHWYVRRPVVATYVGNWDVAAADELRNGRPEGPKDRLLVRCAGERNERDAWLVDSWDGGIRGEGERCSFRHALAARRGHGRRLAGHKLKDTPGL